MSWWQTEAGGIQAPQMKLACGVCLHVAEGTEGKKETENKGKRERRGKQKEDRNGKNLRRQRGRKTLIARRNVELLKVSIGIPRTDLMRRLRHGNPLQYSCLENAITEEPGQLQSMGSQTRQLLFLFFLLQHVKIFE